jgi:FtsP/CotA-like multicopper oxidase with cupredoxin domain
LTAGRIARALATAGALVSFWAAPADARVRDYWVAAVPDSFNIVPNGRDAIHGMDVDPADSIFPTVIYQRYSKGWGHRLANAERSATDGDPIPGPLIRARAGDKLRIHFKNMDTLRGDPHSMHFHGVHYKPGSDGSFLPGFSTGGDDVAVGKSFTYRLRAGRDAAGVWPFHDHSSTMEASLAGGLYGALSIAGRHERRADREFLVAFSSHAGFQTINGRAFVGNTPVFHGRVGETVQWNVLAIGDAHHTFHVHGHRWREDGHGVDTKTVGPAESFRVRWREDAPGTWLYHCHVETHMAQGMIGIYRVRR